VTFREGLKTARMKNRSKSKFPVVWVLLPTVILATVAFSLYKAWPILFPEVVAAAPLDPRCNLRSGSCIGVLPGGGKVSFEISPPGIPALEPLTLSVLVEGPDAREVEVDFAGTDMNMGYNRVRLQRDGPGVWSGRGMLPICVRNVMGWEATVLLRFAEGIKAAPFRFDTYRSGY
jgi:hypothetical protein